MYSNNSIFKPGITLKQLEEIEGKEPKYIGYINAYELNNIETIKSDNFNYYFAKIDSELGLYSLLFQTRGIECSDNYGAELKNIFISAIKEIEKNYSITIPINRTINIPDMDFLLKEENSHIQQKVYFSQSEIVENKIEEIIVTLNVEGEKKGYISLEYCFDEEALRQQKEEQSEIEEKVETVEVVKTEEIVPTVTEVEETVTEEPPISLENALLNEIQKTEETKTDQFSKQSEPNKQEKRENLLPILGTVFCILIILIFSYGPAKKLFVSFSWKNFIYFFISLAFHIFAFYVPFYIYKKFKEFVVDIPKEKEYLKSGDSEELNTHSSHRVWKAYKSTFFSKDFGLVRRTRANADMYFNFDGVITSLSTKYPWSHALKIVSSSFIGLGILGTFIGFADAMTHLNIDDSSKMIEGIKALISQGLTTAFNTSIIGVFCSLIYNFFIYTPIVHKINNTFQELCDELDTEYYVSETEALMKYSMVTDENDQKVTFSESLRLILQNMNKQSLALERFNSDLAEKMQNINENMNATFEKISSSVSGDLKEVVLDDIHFEMNGLKDSLSSSTEQLNAAAETLKDVVDRIKGDVGEKITSFDEALVESLNNSKEAALHLEAVPEKIQTVSSMLDTAGTSLASVSDTVASNMATIHDGLSDILSDLQTTQDKVSEILAQAKMNEENSGQNLKDVLSETDKVLEGFKEVDKNLSHVFSQLTDQISKYTNTVGGNLDTYLSSFAEASTVFSKSIQGSITEFGETIDTFNQNLAQMQKTSDSFDASIKHLEKTIKKDNK